MNHFKTFFWQREQQTAPSGIFLLLLLVLAYKTKHSNLVKHSETFQNLGHEVRFSSPQLSGECVTVPDQALWKHITEEIRTVDIVEMSPLANLSLFREQNDLSVQTCPDNLWRNPSIRLFKGYLQFGWKIESKLLTWLCTILESSMCLWVVKCRDFGLLRAIANTPEDSCQNLETYWSGWVRGKE